MTTKLNSSQSQNIEINSRIKEEILIKSLIDEIYKAEEKISQINNSKDNIQNGINLNNQKLFELKALQNNLQQKILLINNNFQSELSSNKSQILNQKKILNGLDTSIKEYENKLSTFNTINFKSPLLTKYALENNINNNILTQEQINDIYLNSKNNNDLNENELKQIMREMEINRASESVIVNNKNEIKKKYEQINENLKMLKEEKLSINDELIDIISFKESLECINKNNIYKLIKNINSKNNKNDLNKISDKDLEEENEQLELYLYELAIIDANKAASKICDEISDAFRIIGTNSKNNNISYIKNDINCSNISKNNTNNNFYPSNKNKENQIFDILDNKTNSVNKDNYNIASHNFNLRNKSLNNSCINAFKENNLLLDKNSLKILIKEDLNNFKNNNFQEDTSNDYYILINNFLNKISNAIIKQLKNNDIIIGSNLQKDLILYLTFFFKILYYDIIIENKLKFIKKDYKTQKKEYKKFKKSINNELLKLENKHDEIKAKKIYIENQLKILNNSKNKEKSQNDNNLSPVEQSYIQICTKINSILKQKEEIKNKINNYEIDLNNKKMEKENEIINLNNEIETIKNEINEINNKNELNTLKSNENIINYRKIIADKFNIMKEQLQLYKEKYGSNLSLYNKFINNINTTIQKTYNKSFFDLEKNKNDFLSIDENNGLIINGAENKNDKYINIKINNNLNNKDYSNNDIKNSKLFSSDRLHSNSSFNKSMNNNINNEENEVSKNLGKILNKTISNLSTNDLFLGDNKNHNFINNIKVEKVNQSFNQATSYANKNNKNKREKKSNSQKQSNVYDNFDIFNKNVFNLNNFIRNKDKNLMEERGRERDKSKENKDENSCKTFSRPFFRKQSKSQGGIPEASSLLNHIKTSKNNILNINLFRHKKNSSNSGIHKGIPRGLKTTNDTNSKNEQNIKTSIKNIKAHITKIEKNHIGNNNYLYKLNPLTKITFCYYRELSSNTGNMNKYNPLKDISSKELCEYPYNFIKSTISLNKNYSSLKIVPSTQLEPIDFKISMVENTVVSSAVKSIIDIHRNYFKWKENNKGKGIINEFIDEQIKKYNNLNQEEIQKCIINKNFNFSLIVNNHGKEKNNRRIEFIICSYDEFKMWINGMAFIIKNKNSILKLINEKINE